jgi:hypothetical protein
VHHLSGCDVAVVYVEVQMLIFVAVTRKPAVFSRSVVRKFPVVLEEVSFHAIIYILK